MSVLPAVSFFDGQAARPTGTPTLLLPLPLPLHDALVPPSAVVCSSMTRAVHSRTRVYGLCERDHSAPQAYAYGVWPPVNTCTLCISVFSHPHTLPLSISDPVPVPVYGSFTALQHEYL